ncbi:MAG: hypothetical protein KBC21_02055 [Candidatus Pacebacteria bacterium]|nr:hypothetical protein [Candidatus Paceibacterota bacterium]
MATVKSTKTRRANPFNITTERGLAQAQLYAHRAYFGASSGGRDFDELNLSEVYHSETEAERAERQFGSVDADNPVVALEDKRLRQRENRNKKLRQKAARAERCAQEEVWRKNEQAKW